MENNMGLDGTWNEVKGKLKQKFILLTDSDLLFPEDKQEEMMGRLETKLGKSKEELQNLISNL